MPGYTLSHCPSFTQPWPVYKKIFVYDCVSIFRFPYFEDGLVFNDSHLIKSPRTLNSTIKGFLWYFDPGFFTNFLEKDYFFEYFLPKDGVKRVMPLFIDYFFIDFYYFDFFNELFYPGRAEINYFWALNALHLYHFDYFYDSDIIVKFVYRPFNGDPDSFFNMAYSGELSDVLVTDFVDLRNFSF